jgi:DNA-binding IclR family transcriptional regulator
MSKPGPIIEQFLAPPELRGWVVVDEEFEPGLIAVAAPVRGMRAHIVAAVNMSPPRFRFADGVDEAGPAVKLVADRLSARLGAPVSAIPDLRESV